jgi:hypothetical protein
MFLKLKQISWVIIIIGNINFVFSQDNDKLTEQKAISLYSQKKYSEALPLFSQLLSLYPKDERYNLYYAACLIETNQNIEKSIKYLQFADSKSNDPIIKYYLGRAYHLLYQFKDAIEQYSAFKQLATSKQVKELQVDKLIEMCYSGQDLIKYISDLTVVDNRRIKSENYFYSYELKEFDGKLVIKPKELKSSVDKKEEPANMVIFLPNNSNIIYYGSYGNSKANGRDIYRIQRLSDGKWGKPENLGNVINTPYDEDFPFLHSDGKTLYFASKGHNSMGGYDIFKSVFDSSANSWTKPVNLDFPINTPYDDYLYITDKDNFYAYFTSNRETRENNITVYKIIVDQNPTLREYKDLEEIINVSKLEVSSLAEIKKTEQSRQKSKTDEMPLLATDTRTIPEKNNITPYSFKPISYKPGLTSQELVNELKNDNEKVLKNAEEISRQSNLAYIIAKQNNEKANEKRKLAYEKNEKLKTIKDPVVAEQTKQEVYTLIEEAEEYERQAITAYNLAQNFESIAQEMKKDVSKSQGFINAIEKQTNVDEAIVDAANKNKERLYLCHNKYSSLQKELEERKNIQKNKENELLTLEELFAKTSDSLYNIEKEINRLQERIDKSNSETEKNHLNLLVEQLNRKAEILETKQIELAEQKEKIKIDLDILNSENTFIKEFANKVATDNRKNEELKKEVADKDYLKREIFDKELSAEIAIAETVKEKVGSKTKTTTGKTEKSVVNQTRTQTTLAQNNTTNRNTLNNTMNENIVTKDDNKENTAIIVKGVNPLLPSTSSDNKISTENFQKEQFNVQYYTNILNEQQQKLEIINNAINKTKDKKEKQLLEQQRNFLIEEIQSNKQNLAESQQKVNQYKKALANELDTALKVTNEELVLRATKYENRYEINFSPTQKRTLIEAEQNKEIAKNIEKQILENNKEIERIERLKISTTNLSEIKQYENELNELNNKQRQLYKDYTIQTDKSNQQIFNIYNEILATVRIYDASNDNIRNALLLEKEIEAIKEKAMQLKKEALLANNYRNKLSYYNRAVTMEQIAIEKQKYAIDLYVSGLQTASLNTHSKTQDNTEKLESTITPSDVKTISLEISPEENKQINKYQAEKSQADVKFEQGKAIYKEIEEKKKLAASIYSESRKKEILKDIDKKEKQALRLLLDAHQIYEKSNQNKYQLYQSQNNKLLQNENVSEENKSIAKQFLREAEFYFEEAQQLRNNSKEVTNIEEKIAMLNKAKNFEDKALSNQEYAIDALTNTDPVIFIASNNLTKVDRLEALDKPINVDDVVRIKTERIISKLSLTEIEKNKLDEVQIKRGTIQQLNTEAEKYKLKLDLANEILKNSTDPKEKKKAQKSIPKLEKEYFARKFTSAELTENVNDNIYQIYESKFSEVRPKTNDTEVKQGKQLEKNANNLYIQAKQLRDKSFITENPYLAYNYLLQADSLEKLAIEEQEKAYGLYLKLKPIEEELKEYAEKKQKKRPVDELIVLKTPANVSPISNERLAEIEKEQEQKAEKEKKSNIAQVTTSNINETVIKEENKQKEQTVNEEDEKISENSNNQKIQIVANTDNLEVNKTEEIKQEIVQQKSNISQQQIVQNQEIIQPINVISKEPEVTTTSSTTTPTFTTASKDLTETVVPKNIKTPMGFAFMPSSPYSEANPIPINPPLPEGLVFKVQIGAFYSPVKEDAFKGLSPVTAEKLEGSKFYRYFVGLFYSEAAALMVRDYIRPIGYPDAFVVAFYNGKRITLFEARQLMKQATAPEYQQLLADEQNKIKSVTSVTPVAKQKAEPSTTIQTTSLQTTASVGENVNQTKGLFYTVQIGVFKNPVSHEALKYLTPLYEDRSYGFIRYLVGKFNDRRKAELEKNKIVNMGITDAFVTAYFNGQKITLTEAANIEALNPNAVIKTSDNVTAKYSGATNTNELSNITNVNVQNLFFRVQIGAFKDKVPFEIAAKFVQVSSKYGIDQETDASNTTLYYAGKFKSYEQALNCKNELVEQGFKDAFIIATDGKQRISVNRARQLLNQ